MVETPRVSVIVPCYNLGQYLDEAVESVLRQTYQDFEIVIVDDGSTEAATLSLLADYQRPRTRVIRAAHAGLAAARNLGIANTTGEYVCALDADDRLEPSYLSKTVRALDDTSVTFVSSWMRTFGEEEWEWKPERCDLSALLCEDTVLTAALVRRDAVLAVGGYDTSMPVQGDEDWDFWLTLLERGYRGAILREVLFNYRRRAGSMSTVCWYGPGHLPLTSYRVAKHRESYRAYLFDVLLHQDAETAAILRRNDEIERYIATELEPTVAARREELASLRARLESITSTPGPDEAGPHVRGRSAAERGDAQATARIRDLESALRASSAEVSALRTSMSWRVTAPLRTLYGWWLRHRRPE